MRKNEARNIDIGLSHISFHHSPLTEQDVGVVYIVTNDYHSEGRALRDHGVDFKNMSNFFGNLADKYHVTTQQSATYNKFIATCKYLADWKYPRSCKRIIIYFAGHAGGSCISMETDSRNPDKTTIDINDILSLFRTENCRGMERILLLDACCNAKNIKCKDNELVACAASEGCQAESLPWTGGMWTKEFCQIFNQKETYNLVTLLEDVKNEMKRKNEMNPKSNIQVPSWKSALKRDVIFIKREGRVSVSSKKITYILKEYRAKYCAMIVDLEMIMKDFIDDTKNGWSVEHMIMSIKSNDNAISADEHLRNAKTVSHVFIVISEHCNMYDYDVLETFIESTKCERAINVLTDFTNELKNSLLMSLSLLSDDTLRCKSDFQPTGSIQKLTIEYRGRDLKPEDIKVIKKILCDHFEDLREEFIQFIAANVGSVKLIFEMSLMVKEYLLQYKITTGAVTSLFEHQINRLIINDEMELKMSAEYADKDAIVPWTKITEDSILYEVKMSSEHADKVGYQLMMSADSVDNVNVPLRNATRDSILSVGLMISSDMFTSLIEMAEQSSLLPIATSVPRTSLLSLMPYSPLIQGSWLYHMMRILAWNYH